MRSTLITAVVVVLSASLVLGATVFRAEIAEAAQSMVVTIIGPLDANGNVAVHEQGTANVNVANSTLPVAGTVNVGNLPAVQQVAGTVGIASSANGVQETNSVALRPFSRQGFSPFGAGNPGAFNAEVDLYTVPAGERVVITYAGAKVSVPTGEHAIVDVRTSSLSIAAAYIPMTDLGAFNVSYANEQLVGGGPVTIVYSPGQHIIVHAFRSQGDGDNIGQLVATVAGYTVSIP
jgi:hypothetical protein